MPPHSIRPTSSTTSTVKSSSVRARSLRVAPPPIAETEIGTLPALVRGPVTAVICVALFTVKLEAGRPPNQTALTPSSPVPEMRTVCPPAAGPDAGLTDVSDGGTCPTDGALNWNAALAVPIPLGVVTETSTGPTAWMGLRARTCVALTKVGVTGVPPNDTCVAPARLVPVMVTRSWPVVRPAAGVTTRPEGAAGNCPETGCPTGTGAAAPNLMNSMFRRTSVPSRPATLSVTVIGVPGPPG
jgi:hypothetical protein